MLGNSICAKVAQLLIYKKKREIAMRFPSLDRPDHTTQQEKGHHLPPLLRNNIDADIHADVPYLSYQISASCNPVVLKLGVARLSSK